MANNGIKHFIRCQECGDSRKHPWKKHCQVFDDGATYCYRCGHSTKLSMETFIAFVLGDMTIEEAIQESMDQVREYQPGIWNRGQLLDQYAIDGEAFWVSYQMRDCNGKVIGWHNRHTRVKEVENEGRRGIGYVGEKLTSSPSSPLIIVEGPADVITTQHVCVFGSLSASALKQCRLQYMWLQPDPDMLDTKLKRKKFVERVTTPAIENGMCFLQGVIVGNADPDEATKLLHIPVEELRAWL